MVAIVRSTSRTIGACRQSFIAFEPPWELRRRGARTPLVLLIASCGAAHLPTMATPMSGLPTPDFLKALRLYSGIPISLLPNCELAELMLPALRVDVEVVESYRLPMSRGLSARFSPNGGCEPGDVSFEQLSAWQQLTRGAFRLQIFPGSHFVLEQSQSAPLKAIQDDSSAYLARSPQPSTS